MIASPPPSILQPPDLTSDEDEVAYLHQLLVEYGVEQVFTVINHQLNSDSVDSIRQALDFLRLAGIGHVKIPDSEANTKVIRTAITSNSTLTDVGKLLSHPHQAVRADAIYTLGKLYFAQAIPILRSHLDLYIAKYPGQLDRLLGELFWLEGKVDFELLEKLLKKNNPAILVALNNLVARSSSELEQSPFNQRLQAVISKQ